MAAAILQFGCTMLCPHGGQVTVVPSQTQVLLGGQPALLASDVFVVAGCPFFIGPAPSPCVKVTWLGAATQVKVAGQAPLLQSSVGLCIAATGVPQGNVIITGIQTKVSGQ